MLIYIHRNLSENKLEGEIPESLCLPHLNQLYVFHLLEKIII